VAPTLLIYTSHRTLVYISEYSQTDPENQQIVSCGTSAD
ncbi:unnamed protein product, partial [Rotaria sp. Silwood1]